MNLNNFTIKAQEAVQQAVQLDNIKTKCHIFVLVFLL